MKHAPSPVSKLSLTDLAGLRNQFEHETQAHETERQRAETAARKAAGGANMFRASIGEVNALHRNKRVEHPRNLSTPEPMHSRAEGQAVPRDSLSNELDMNSLLKTDDTLSYRRPGIGDDVLKELHCGEWATQDQVGLHGMCHEKVRGALAAFLRCAVQHGICYVRVIHGKGLGSSDKTPVLRGKVRSWLVQKKEVITFIEPRNAASGAGTALVLLCQPYGS